MSPEHRVHLELEIPRLQAWGNLTVDSGQSPPDLLPDLHRLRCQLGTIVKDTGDMFIDDVVGDPVWPGIFAGIFRRVYLDRPVAAPSPRLTDPPDIV